MASISPAVALKRERRFFSWAALSMLAVVIIGFGPSYYFRDMVAPYAPFLPMTPLVHLHAVVFSAWLLLFVAQTQLVAWGRSDLHRKLGLAAFILLPVMIIIATLTAIHGAARASGPPFPPESFLIVPLLDVPVFTLLIGTALAKRGDPRTHKRLMFIAMTGMMAPALGRMPFTFPLGAPGIFLPCDIFLVALVIYDFVALKRLHSATLWGGSFLLATQAIRLAVWDTEIWLGFARWVMGFAT